MITNFYDYLQGNSYEVAEAEKTDRREFLKRMGLAGLAIVGLPSIIANISGCIPAPARIPDVPLRSMADIANKKELELEDFLLSREEMYGVRLSQGVEERWGGDIRRPNPDLYGNKNMCIGNRMNYNHCVRKLDAQYCTGTLPKRVMREHIGIGIDEYSSKKECEEVVERFKKNLEKNKEEREAKLFKNYEGHLVVLPPFFGVIGTRTNVPEAFLNDARRRIEDYKRIRKIPSMGFINY